MEERGGFRAFTGVAAILAGLLAIASGVAGAAALGPDVAAGLDPKHLLEISTGSAGLLRWSLLLDVFGYYLLLAPLAIYLWYSSKSVSRPWVTLFTACGLFYILIGAIGASILAAVLPPLIESYRSASGATREAAGLVLIAFVNAVYQGLWNPLEMVLGGVWWLGSGAIIQHTRLALGITTLILGAAAWLDALGAIFELQPLFLVGLCAVLLLIPLWALWFGIDLLRRAD
jgi:hypothetical protein